MDDDRCWRRAAAQGDDNGGKCCAPGNTQHKDILSDPLSTTDIRDAVTVLML